MFFLIVTNLQNFSNVFMEKNPCIGGPEQYKPMLFKGQLYFDQDSFLLYRVV